MSDVSKGKAKERKDRDRPLAKSAVIALSHLKRGF